MKQNMGEPSRKTGNTYNYDTRPTNLRIKRS